MKRILTATFCSLVLSFSASAQNPVAPPPSIPPAPAATASPVPAATALPVATATPAIVVTVSPGVIAAPASTIPPVAATATPALADDDDFDRAIEKKINKHFSVDFGKHHGSHDSDDDTPWIAIPIVLIVFLCIFGLPVAIVGIILYFSFSRSRAMHKTVRMMVEKGQPVPEALLNPPPVIRQRSDLRRGIVLLMVGVGLMVFFGACNDWEGGAWSIGFIPFIIGLGYLLFWRFDVRREDSSPKV